MDKVDQIQAAIEQAVIAAQKENINDLFNAAQQRIPRHLASLADSGEINEPARDGDQIKAGITYSSPYAAVQHKGYRKNRDGSITKFVEGERRKVQVVINGQTREVWRGYNTPGTGPRYLSEPLEDYAQAYRQNIADHIKKVTEP